jgi:alcohol dehydrogenase
MPESSSLMLTVPRRLQWVREVLPEPGPEDVLIQTTSGAISVGSEIPQYLGTSRSAAPPRYPRMTGYESVGRVTRRGALAQGIQVGDRVISFYGHRTQAVVPATSAIRVPDDVSDAVALLAILTCDVAKGMRKLMPLPEQPIAISGAGAIGLLTLVMLSAVGCYQVDVVEPLPERRELAHRLGARAVLAPEDLGEQDEAYALGFECSSRDQAFGMLQRLVRPQGQICILADGNLEPLTLTPAFHRKELRIVGSSDGWDYHAHAQWYFSILGQRFSPLEAMFDCRVFAVDLAATFARLADADRRCIKVLVQYEGEGSTPE